VFLFLPFSHPEKKQRKFPAGSAGPFGKYYDRL